jgi:hypothetical protein
MVQDKPSGSRRALSAAVVRVTAIWVLTVALIKLFRGSPADLPMMVQNFIGSMDLGLKFQLVVAIELSVVFLAFLRPRWAWPLLAGMFTLFVGMLATMMAQGVDSCGCFGGALKIAPWVMLLVDGACLLALLATQPWKNLPSTEASWKLVVPALGVALAAPFVFFENRQLEETPGNGVNVPNAAATDGTGGQPPVATPVPWSLPATMPVWQSLTPNKENASWIGKSLKETPLGSLLDVELYPQDAIWILYRITCDHCAAEFLAINADPVRSKLMYVLVRIPEADEEAHRQVHTYPELMIEAILPPLAKGYVGQTPWTLEVEGGVVKSATPGF